MNKLPRSEGPVSISANPNVTAGYYNTANLLALADFIEANADAVNIRMFSMADDHDGTPMTLEEIAQDCPACACALGWAAAGPFNHIARTITKERFPAGLPNSEEDAAQFPGAACDWDIFTAMAFLVEGRYNHAADNALWKACFAANLSSDASDVALRLRAFAERPFVWGDLGPAHHWLLES